MSYFIVPGILLVVLIIAITVVIIRCGRFIGYGPKDIQKRLDIRSKCL